MTPVHVEGTYCTGCNKLCLTQDDFIYCLCYSVRTDLKNSRACYPSEWVACKITIEFPNNPETYEEVYDLPPGTLNKLLSGG